MRIDFVEDDVPDNLVVQLAVFSNQVNIETIPPEIAADIYADNVPRDRNYLASFSFLLEFDPKFTATGKVIPVNQTVIMDGQSITITEIEIYPTHLRVDIEEASDNTAWIKDLDFYIETDWGMKFETGSGITATGSAESPSMISYRADSPYFYRADHLQLVITGAQWLRKDMETTYLNLATGEHGELPQGTAFDSATKQENGWVVRFRADWNEEAPMIQLFSHQYFDTDGKEYAINQWSGIGGDADEDGSITYFYDEFPLLNYPYDEVWLCPLYSHNWVAENRIVIPIQ